jgi:hypothetical protein
MPGMNFSELSNTVDAVQRLKEEIERLTEEQTEALKAASFGGMTAAEAKQYDERRKTITRLVQELSLLRQS